LETFYDFLFLCITVRIIQETHFNKPLQLQRDLNTAGSVSPLWPASHYSCTGKLFVFCKNHVQHKHMCVSKMKRIRKLTPC